MLSAPSSPEDLAALVNHLTVHHKEYYTFKWVAVWEEMLAFYGSMWLTPMETAYLWVTVFCLLGAVGMTDEQTRRMEREMER